MVAYYEEVLAKYMGEVFIFEKISDKLYKKTLENKGHTIWLKSYFYPHELSIIESCIKSRELEDDEDIDLYEKRLNQ
jgi:hypothetical protein